MKNTNNLPLLGKDTRQLLGRVGFKDFRRWMAKNVYNFLRKGYVYISSHVDADVDLDSF